MRDNTQSTETDETGHRDTRIVRAGIMSVMIAMILISTVAPTVTVGTIGFAAAQTSGGDYNVSNSTHEYSLDVSAQDRWPREVTWNDDGTKLVFIGSNNEGVYSYDVTDAYNISTATFNTSIPAPAKGQGVQFSSDGTKMYLTENNNDVVRQYTLSTPYDISTATHQLNLSVTRTGTPQGIDFNSDGTKLFIAEQDNDSVLQYSLSDPWNVSTAVYQRSFQTSDNYPNEVFISPSGTTILVIGGETNHVYQYSLSEAYNVSTASYVAEKDVSAQETGVAGLSFTPNGSKMFVSGTSSSSIHQYDVTGTFPGGPAPDTEDSNLTIESREYLRPNQSVPYEVFLNTTNTTTNTSTRIDVTANATVLSNDTSLLTVNQTSNTFIATNNSSLAGTVNVTAYYTKDDGTNVSVTKEIVVAPLTAEHLELIPTATWRFAALFGGGGVNEPGEWIGNGFMFVLIIATLGAVAAARFASSFAGLSMGTLIVTMGWMAGYVGYGMAAVCVFISLFIGLNVAANINYTAGAGFGRQ